MKSHVLIKDCQHACQCLEHKQSKSLPQCGYRKGIPESIPVRLVLLCCRLQYAKEGGVCCAQQTGGQGGHPTFLTKKLIKPHNISNKDVQGAAGREPGSH